MSLKSTLYFLTLYMLFACNSSQRTIGTDPGFELITKDQTATIVYDKTGPALDSISAHLLAADIALVTGKKPKVTTDIKTVTGNAVIIGSQGSALVENFIVSDTFSGDWETYVIQHRKNPTKNLDEVLLIAGADPRGTAYGVFSISEKIGVSPWYWWADVTPKKQKELVVPIENLESKSPAVKFRGIFINDEDWGLQPWAENTFEPETGDIGPKSYAKVFELLLRLRANTIWPAMHPSTKAFFHYPGNAQMAEKYEIVLGSSHAEPMLRNNVDEWDHATMGDFNYFSNKEKVLQYWEDRVKAAKEINGIYTVGMRGVHDSGMRGAKNQEEAVAKMNEIISDQRDLFQKYIDEPSSVPQVFTVYKEVLDLYEAGLDLPEDITLMWTDDNYGYIRRLADSTERKRSGGSGVYYHASYWGRPHDYLWLSSTHPALIKEEMLKAYDTGADKIWILNVGDIKPAEYNMQFFMDLAFAPETFRTDKSILNHAEAFYTNQFDCAVAKEIAEIKMKYYDLAFVRKPEFMGWSQTEPTTGINPSDFRLDAWGDENQQRLKAYADLVEKVNRIKPEISAAAQDAFFQLVEYPVKGAAAMNRKFLYRDRAGFFDGKNAVVAKNYKQEMIAAYDTIVALTEKYNTQIADGKWQGIMDMKPRRLPVYDLPQLNLKLGESDAKAGFYLERRQATRDSLTFPTYYPGDKTSYSVSLYLKNAASKASFAFSALPGWLQVSEKSGEINTENPEKRVNVSINWEKWKELGSPDRSSINLELANKTYPLTIKIQQLASDIAKGTFIEKNGLVVIPALEYSEAKNFQEPPKTLEYLGRNGKALQLSSPLSKTFSPTENKNSAPYLSYKIALSAKQTDGQLTLKALPTHPVTGKNSLRVGVQWNTGPIEIIDFKTYGRSEIWKQNVLGNEAAQQLKIPLGEKTIHTLHIYPIDPGVILQTIFINTTSAELPYTTPSPTTK